MSSFSTRLQTPQYIKFLNHEALVDFSIMLAENVYPALMLFYRRTPF